MISQTQILRTGPKGTRCTKNQNRREGCWKLCASNREKRKKRENKLRASSRTISSKGKKLPSSSFHLYALLKSERLWQCMLMIGTVLRTSCSQKRMVPCIQICSPLYFQVVAKIFIIFVRTNKRIGLSIEKSTSELLYVF